MGQALNKVYRNLSETGDLDVETAQIMEFCSRSNGWYGGNGRKIFSAGWFASSDWGNMKFLARVFRWGFRGVSNIFDSQVFWRAMVGVDI